MLCTSQLGYNLRHGLPDTFYGKCSGNYFPCVNYILNVPCPLPVHSVHLAARNAANSSLNIIHHLEWRGEIIWIPSQISKVFNWRSWNYWKLNRMAATRIMINRKYDEIYVIIVWYMFCMWRLKPVFFLFSILYWIFLDSITIMFFLFPIDDVLIICKSIIPNNGLDFYIIKFNTWPAWICLEYWAMQSIDKAQPGHIPTAFDPSCCSALLNDL